MNSPSSDCAEGSNQDKTSRSTKARRNEVKRRRTRKKHNINWSYGTTNSETRTLVSFLNHFGYYVRLLYALRAQRFAFRNKRETWKAFSIIKKKSTSCTNHFFFMVCSPIVSAALGEKNLPNPISCCVFARFSVREREQMRMVINGGIRILHRMDCV